MISVWILAGDGTFGQLESSMHIMMLATQGPHSTGTVDIEAASYPLL